MPWEEGTVPCPAPAAPAEVWGGCFSAPLPTPKCSLGWVWGAGLGCSQDPGISRESGEPAPGCLSKQKGCSDSSGAPRPVGSCLGWVVAHFVPMQETPEPPQLTRAAPSCSALPCQRHFVFFPVLEEGFGGICLVFKHPGVTWTIHLLALPSS